MRSHVYVDKHMDSIQQLLSPTISSPTQLVIDIDTHWKFLPAPSISDYPQLSHRLVRRDGMHAFNIVELKQGTIREPRYT